MGQGTSEVLTFAVVAAISPVPIIAVILILFSQRAKVNGPMFLAGWALALAVVSGVAYLVSDASGASTSSSASDTISWEDRIRRRLSPARGAPVAGPADTRRRPRGAEVDGRD